MTDRAGGVMKQLFRSLTILLVGTLVGYSCFSTIYDSLKKNHFKKDIHICFYNKSGGLGKVIHGTEDIYANKKL